MTYCGQYKATNTCSTLLFMEIINYSYIEKRIECKFDPVLKYIHARH